MVLFLTVEDSLPRFIGTAGSFNIHVLEGSAFSQQIEEQVGATPKILGRSGDDAFCVFPL